MESSVIKSKFFQFCLLLSDLADNHLKNKTKSLKIRDKSSYNRGH